MSDWLPGVLPGIEMSLTFPSRKKVDAQLPKLTKQALKGLR
jgi:hypothetical protein